MQGIGEGNDLEYSWDTFDEQVKRPSLESSALSLTVSTTLGHRFSNIAANDVSSEVSRLAHRRPATPMITLGGWTDRMARVSFGIADWLRVRRMVWSAVDCSFGSGRSFEWTSMTRAELTAEDRLPTRTS